MHLQSVIECEVSQKVKNKYSILTHKCVQSINRKAVQMDLSSRAEGETETESPNIRTPRRKQAGWWWRICKIGADTYTLLMLCMK